MQKTGIAARRRDFIAAMGLIGVGAAIPRVVAADTNTPGVTETEIKIGQTMPYSGPASAYSSVARVELAYFRMLNEHGGVNGRKINLVSVDDGYVPAKTVEQTRKLVEQDSVAFLFNSIGTATNAAVEKYLNDRKIPQLFVSSFASRFNDPQHFPWTMGALGNYRGEGQVYGLYVREQRPDAKIGVLYQNDDYGRDYLTGFRSGLGDRAASMIIKQESYEATDPTIDQQIVSLQASGADTLADFSSAKFAAQAIRRIYDIGWKPLHILNSVSSSVAAVLRPAGVEKAVGIISGIAFKDATDPRWHDDPAYREWLAFMETYDPEGDINDVANVYGYSIAQMCVQVLKQCDDDLSRQNIMRQAANLHELVLPMLLPGITINTSPTDYQPLKSFHLARFDGTTWQPFGDLISVR